jgi:hypothetical protein
MLVRTTACRGFTDQAPTTDQRSASGARNRATPPDGSGASRSECEIPPFTRTSSVAPRVDKSIPEFAVGHRSAWRSPWRASAYRSFNNSRIGGSISSTIEPAAPVHISAAVRRQRRLDRVLRYTSTRAIDLIGKPSAPMQPPNLCPILHRQHSFCLLAWLEPGDRTGGQNSVPSGGQISRAVDTCHWPRN